ncbi:MULTISPECIES: helix-turn-helix transcriptional regulator [unclassified Streptomyces]|uniref:helix-turn-helix domain-containing protein n=1 Tax=unclassified Streptomyces TaxID=2593676 RepID=UPI0033FAE693
MSDPTVRRRRLGSELRSLREALGLKQEDVAGRVDGINTVKLSRVESGRVGIKAAELKALLNLYDVDDAAKRESMHSLARDGARRGWWQSYQDVITPAYADLISLEQEAKSVRVYQTTLIPGLLQTADYARATVSAINMTSSPAEVDALVHVRLQRQAVLTRPEPLELRVIVHEAALRASLPGRTMRDQLQRLLDYAKQTNVTIQVLPLTSSAHPGLSGPYTVLGFPETADLDVVHIEHLTSSLYVEDPAEVSIYGRAFDRLAASALPFDSSADLIARLKD